MTAIPKNSTYMLVNVLLEIKCKESSICWEVGVREACFVGKLGLLPSEQFALATPLMGSLTMKSVAGKY